MEAARTLLRRLLKPRGYSTGSNPCGVGYGLASRCVLLTARSAAYPTTYHRSPDLPGEEPEHPIESPMHQQAVPADEAKLNTPSH